MTILIRFDVRCVAKAAHELDRMIRDRLETPPLQPLPNYNDGHRHFEVDVGSTMF